MLSRRSSRDHVLDLDPQTLHLDREGACLFGAAPTGEISRRKVWGERCSGTNFVDALLERNCPALRLRGARWQWKHGQARLTGANPRILNVFVIRDPFHWAQSLHRSPWHLSARLRGRDFPSFIRQEWVGVFYDQGKYTPERPGDRHPVLRRRFRDIWEMRTVKLRHSLVAASRLPNGVFVRYEDVSEDPRAFVATVARRFGLQSLPEFQPVKDYKGEAWKSFEGNSEAPMNDAEREYILSRLDPKLEGFLGYLPDAGASGNGDLRHHLSFRENS